MVTAAGVNTADFWRTWSARSDDYEIARAPADDAAAVLVGLVATVLASSPPVEGFSPAATDTMLHSASIWRRKPAERSELRLHLAAA